jgi:phosphoribosylformylglycinamidine synthase
MNNKINDEIVEKHGIKKNEYAKILEILGREPNLTELGIFSAMWSEHCSYKSTRIHLKKLYTHNKNVICGPGENAGIIDAGDKDAIVFKMESHNHPSYIEPFNGAATGVGGILRDVFTMGARPIANVNSLKFGNIDSKEGEVNPRMQELLDGVVDGISFYGNCVGVPMVFGETKFDKCYNGNILVNAMSAGLVDKDKIFYSAANEVGASIIYFGSKTGKDGINGAKMSSGSFSEDDSQNYKPTIQVGDPFYEKLLIEATLELMKSGCVLSIQDMGAAGLTCSSAEMGGKGGTGVELWLDKVPLREVAMSAYEIMLSESQERMLMTVKPEKESIAEAILVKWNLDFAVIGRVTNDGMFVIKKNGIIEANIPIAPLSDSAPIYDRPFIINVDNEIKNPKPLASEDDVIDVLKCLMESQHLTSREDIFEKYDRGVQGRVVASSPSNFGLVKFGQPYEVCIKREDLDKNYRLAQVMLSKLDGKSACSGFNFLAGSDNQAPGEIKYSTQKGLIVTSSITPRYTASDAKMGAMQAVLKTYRTITAAGGDAIAITNCLNFGNPEKPEIMGQIVAAIDGLAEVCKFLDYPVVSGNVSLYNQTGSKDINPTPTIGAVGIIKDYTKYIPNALTQDEDMIFVIGSNTGHLTNTLYAKLWERTIGGKMPQIDMHEEKINAHFVKEACNLGLLSGSSDVSSGGLLPSLVKMSLNNESEEKIGFILNLEEALGSIDLISYLFSEDQARYILLVPKDKSVQFISLATELGVISTLVGFTGGEKINVNNKYLLNFKDLHY